MLLLLSKAATATLGHCGACHEKVRATAVSMAWAERGGLPLRRLRGQNRTPSNKDGGCDPRRATETRIRRSQKTVRQPSSLSRKAVFKCQGVLVSDSRSYQRNKKAFWRGRISGTES